MMTSVYWRLGIQYYQYNDGRANNGYFYKIVEFDDKDEAVRVANVIKNAIANNNGEIEDGESIQDYIDGYCGGYYTSVMLFQVAETETQITDF